MQKVTIIILNWNGWQDTIKCLESLNKINYDNFEVALADNGSTDNSAQRIDGFIESSKLKFRVLSFKFQENKGFANGVNAIISNLLEASRQGGNYEASKSQISNLKYILLLNNDTIVSPDFLKKLIDVAENDNKIGIAGPMIYFYDKPDYINSAGSKMNWLTNKGEYIGYNEKDNGQFGDKPYEVDYISGACLLIKKEVINKIGLMPEKYFLYYEDTDWNFQAKKAGYKSVLVPDAKIWHKESASAKKIGAKYIYYHTRNGILFNGRCAPFCKKALIHPYNFYVFAKQIMKLFIPSKKERAIAAITGIKDYYIGKFGKI